MSQLTHPLCFHPTTVVMVSGDRFHLDKLCATVNTNTTILKHFVDPKAALNYLNSLNLAPFNRRCTHALEEDVRSRHSMGVNLLKIQDEIYETNRFSQISGVVMDYDMPGMNAFDFCEQLENDRLSKILLTNQVDACLITDAFNRGLINKYVYAKSDNLKEELNNSLYEIQMKYFLHNSNVLFNTVISRLSESNTIFTEPRYIALFKELLEDNYINEYYLTAINGSYLLKNIKNELFQLNIYDSETENAKFLEGKHGNYFYNFSNLTENAFQKQPIFLEQFYQKHPRESVY